MTALGLQAAAIDVAGEQMIGGLYLAAAVDAAPAAVFLHGLPGHELNLDLAKALQAVGIHSLYFHFRGSWGSGGDFSLNNLVADTKAATEWLSSQPGVDPERVCLVGYSLGAWAGLIAFAQVPTLRAAVALSPMIDAADSPFDQELIDGLLDPLIGTDLDQIEREWNSLPPVTDHVDGLTNRPVLIATGDQDTIFVPSHFQRLRQELPTATWERFPSADHGFAAVRAGLIHRVRGWLVEHLEPNPA